MKYLLFFFAAKVLTASLGLIALALGLATLLNLLQINSIFNDWFNSSFYIPALSGLAALALRFITKLVTEHFLDMAYDEDASA